MTAVEKKTNVPLDEALTIAVRRDRLKQSNNVFNLNDVSKMAAIEKKTNVPLDEALTIAGTGLYTNYVIFTTGFIIIAGMMNIESIAMVLPSAGCEMMLSSTEKGILTSMSLAGMLVTGPMAGFLSDAYGRKRITTYGQLASGFFLLLSGLAPNIVTLMVLCFLNGIALTASFTPTYVIVNEFCPSAIRAKALIIASLSGSLANVVLPGLAWLVMPLDVHIPVGITTITSWRLYMIIMSIPTFITLLFLCKIPETPKFLLNDGKPEETMEVLRSIFAVNHKKRREDYPVLSVILDSSDEGYGAEIQCANPLLRSMKDMYARTRLLFSRSFILYTALTSFLLFSQCGTFYSFMLWFPEQLSKIIQYSSTNDVYDVTLCDLMSQQNIPADDTLDCQLNYNFFSYVIIFGFAQLLIGIFVSIYSGLVGKRTLLAGLLVATGIMSSAMMFFRLEYLTICSVAFIIIADAIGFPLIASLIMDFYPTYIRSTAIAVAIIFGRFGATIGNQILGVLFENHCEKAYFGVSAMLFMSAVLCLVLPSRKNI